MSTAVAGFERERRSAARRVVQAVKRANAPPPAEDSIALRVATALAVFAGLAACESVGEISPVAAILATIGIAVGMTFSYLTRRRPWQWVKIVLAIAVLGVFAHFVLGVSVAARAGEIASVEAPLAALFVWVQVIHALDVPARRDLLFSLAASGALMAVAGAQALDLGFAVYVVVWLVALVTGLVLSWRSSTGAAGRPVGSVVASILAVALGGALVVAVVPAPVAERALTLPASITNYLALPHPGDLTGGGNGAEPAQPGSPGGTTGVGGYLGFAGPLDTAVRGSLGNEVVLRVRATVPGYFLGTTYDHWDGRSWSSSPRFRGADLLRGGSPFQIPGAAADLVAGVEDVQTFYVATPLPNLIFSAGQARQVWFPDNKLYVGHDGSLRTGVAMTPGTVYTVISGDDQRAPAELAADTSPVANLATVAPDLQLSAPYAAVRQLTRSITAHATTTYAKVTALEAWMAGHVRYSTDIPPLLPSQDAVDQFLFRSRVGYCEQISTALAVMLRTIGVPAREAIGYVPGPYDPLTDLYEIQAKDAHAWVQVWFPGIGWQSFDPTAEVPLAPPDPGAVLLHDAWQAVAGLPWVIILPVAAAVLAGEALRRRLRRRPRSWAEKIARELEWAAARAGVGRAPTDTLEDFARRLSGAASAVPEGAPSMPLPAVVAVLERSAYGPAEPAEHEKSAARSAVRRYRRSIGFGLRRR